MELSEHETNSQHRYEKLKHHIKKGHEMPEVKNVFEPVVNPLGAMGYGGYGAGAGGLAGAGAGILGGILGGALLNRGGLFGGVDGAGRHVTPEQLQTAIAGLNDSTQNSMVLQGIGDIKAAVPLAEAQAQLAIAQSQNALSNQIGQQSLAVAQGFGNTSQQISQAQAAVIAVGESVKDSVNATSAATQLAIAGVNTQSLQNTFALSQAITNDGDKTRALLIKQNEDMLNRQLAVAEAALLEARNEGRARGTEINVTQQVTQNQAQAQAQLQQQQQLVLLNTIAGHLVGLQNAVATNSNMIIGNTGAVGTGPQTANPINVAR